MITTHFNFRNRQFYRTGATAESGTAKVDTANSTETQNNEGGGTPKAFSKINGLRNTAIGLLALGMSFGTAEKALGQQVVSEEPPTMESVDSDSSYSDTAPPRAETNLPVPNNGGNVNTITTIRPPIRPSGSSSDLYTNSVNRPNNQVFSIPSAPNITNSTPTGIFFSGEVRSLSTGQTEVRGSINAGVNFDSIGDRRVRSEGQILQAETQRIQSENGVASEAVGAKKAGLVACMGLGKAEECVPFNFKRIRLPSGKVIEIE